MILYKMFDIVLYNISMNNQACKTRPEIINVNSNNPVFYPFSIKTSKCSGNCNKSICKNLRS